MAGVCALWMEKIAASAARETALAAMNFLLVLIS